LKPEDKVFCEEKENQTGSFPFSFVTKSKPIPRDIVRSADHITKSDQYDQHTDQCDLRGDDAI